MLFVTSNPGKAREGDEILGSEDADARGVRVSSYPQISESDVPLLGEDFVRNSGTRLIR